MILHRMSYASNLHIDSNTNIDDESFKKDNQVRNVMFRQYQLAATKLLNASHYEREQESFNFDRTYMVKRAKDRK